MTARTEGFVGARLREAREARSLTAAALARALDVTPAAVSQYEKGVGSPRPEVLDIICRVLRFPIQFFLRDVPPRDSATVLYRSLSSATKTARTRAERHLAWVVEDIVPYLAEYVEFPPVRLPELPVPNDPFVLSDDDIEAFAGDARRLLGLRNGPIGNLLWLLENAGTTIVRTALGSDKLDSFSAWMNGRPFIVIGTEKGSAVRYNFDLGHELGHLLLHRHRDRDRVFTPAEHHQLEQQANRFSGAFLLPAEEFRNDVFAPTLGAFRSLKPKWRTSIGVMINRVSQLGMVREKDETWLWMQYGRRGWKRWEPLDDDLDIQEPQLLRQAVTLLLDERVQTRADLLAHVALSPEDIERLLGFESGYLSREETMPLRLRLGTSDSTVVPFPGKHRGYDA
jgi:Zn-dependent peptidase ImmA (M78 family)/transcriptional regulator with XRE-family HTH domain